MPLHAATPIGDVRRPARSRRFDLRLKPLEFGLVCRMPFGTFRLLSFPGCLLLFQRLMLGIQLGLAGRKLLDFRRLDGRCLLTL